MGCKETEREYTTELGEEVKIKLYYNTTSDRYSIKTGGEEMRLSWEAMQRLVDMIEEFRSKGFIIYHKEDE